jgi:hypothetical protein
MGSTLSFEYKEAIPHLRLLADTLSPKIILSAIDIADCPTDNPGKQPSCQLYI